MTFLVINPINNIAGTNNITSLKTDIIIAFLDCPIDCKKIVVAFTRQVISIVAIYILKHAIA